MRRRRHRSSTPAVLAQILLWLLAWQALTGPAHLPHVAAGIILGAAWGIAAGFRLRGRLDRAVRRAMSRLIYRWMYRW
jgi:hypothetical protein